MNTAVFIACGQLLKHVHVTKLKVISCSGLPGKTQKKPVLIEIIIYNLVAKIYMYFIVGNKRNGIRYYSLAA